jgi:UTP--glucose-1-phosphate uridylyltransferase
MRMAIEDGKPMFGCEIKDGKYYDTGNKLEYLKTVVDFALAHPELGEDFKAYLQDLRF